MFFSKISSVVSGPSVLDFSFIPSKSSIPSVRIPSIPRSVQIWENLNRGNIQFTTQNLCHKNIIFSANNPLFKWVSIPKVDPINNLTTSLPPSRSIQQNHEMLNTKRKRVRKMRQHKHKKRLKATRMKRKKMGKI